FFFFSSRRRHTRFSRDWSSDVCSSDLISSGDLAAKVKNDLGAVGITINVRQVAQSELLKAYRGQQSQMVMLSWFVDYPDPDDFRSEERRVGKECRSGWCPYHERRECCR